MKWLTWVDVCKPISLAGFGLTTMEDTFNVLIAKQVTELYNQWGNAWAKLILSKQMNCGRFWSGEEIQYHLQRARGDMHWTLGNGEDIRVWKDKWIMEEPVAMYQWTMGMDKINENTVSDSIDQDGISKNGNVGRRRLGTLKRLRQ